MRYFLGIISFCLLFSAGTSTALAVPPPDFLFNIGSQLIQIFSVLAVFLSAVAISAGQFLKVYFHKLKHRKAVWAGIALAVVGISFGVAYFAQQYEQNRAYEQWITQSEQANANLPEAANPLDQLKLNGAETVKVPEVVVVPTDDKYVTFIKTYYANLANGKIEDSYAVSKKSVSLETYLGWYQGLKSIAIDFIQLIADHKYSLQLSLDYGKEIERYAVLMTLQEDGSGAISIADSESRLLSTKSVAAETEKVEPPLVGGAKVVLPPSPDLALPISNADFAKAIKAGAVYVLDAREDEEYVIGNFPGSVHIRSADLVAGDWIQLPTDQVIFVFCWSGMRGKDVAEFLRTKNLAARYVENGASDWVAYGGKWAGDIKFTSKYGAAQYVKLFTLTEVQRFVSQGVVMVDSRPATKFARGHIPGSINIPMIYTPTSQIDLALAQVPSSASVITVCDDFISCFDAKVTGIKLEKAGHTFLGRYNKPWEYQN